MAAKQELRKLTCVLSEHETNERALEQAKLMVKNGGTVLETYSTDPAASITESSETTEEPTICINNACAYYCEDEENGCNQWLVVEMCADLKEFLACAPEGETEVEAA